MSEDASHRYPATIHVDPAMIVKIDTPIDEALISRRPGGGGSSQSYLKGDIIADQLNTVFGPLGWSKQSRIHTVDDWDETKTVQRNNQPTQIEMHMVQVISDVTLTIKKVTPDGTDTVFVEQGIGYGEVESGKSRKEAFGMAVKGASTDGLKRCASLLGKAFGMMMASSGRQDDIEYAHNGKSQDLSKARAMRSGGSGGARGRDEGRGRDDRGRQEDRGQQRGGRDERDQRRDGGDRQRDDRGRDDRQRSDAPRDAAPRRDAPQREQAQGGAERQREAQPQREAQSQPQPQRDDRPASGGESGAGKPKAAARVPNTTYPLESVPVTKDDQTDFAATLASRTKEMRQRNDREGLVKQHINTIRNLDAPIRRRLMERLAEVDVDVDRIAA